MARSRDSFSAVVLAMAIAACGDDDAAHARDAGARDAGSETGGPDAAHDAGPPGAGPDAAAGSVCPVTDFVPCGGDVQGVWRVLDFCPEDEDAAAALCQSPFDDRAECVGDGNAQTCRTLRDTTMEWTEDGRLSIRGTTRIEATYRFDDACLAVVAPSGSTPAERCAALANDRLACASEDGGCVCTATTEPEPSDDDTVYRVEGNDLVIGSTGDEVVGAYCVEDDVLTLDVAPHPVSWRYWVLAR